MKVGHQHLHSHDDDHGHDSKATGFKAQLVGLSLGLLAVIIAICASVGSSERDHMTQVMISQARATSKEVAASVKLRLVLMELAQTAALPKEQRDNERIEANLRLYKDYKRERDVANELAESMTPAIENHFVGTEKYELAQLWAEIALTIGSISLLLKNRYVWYASLVLAAICVFQFSSTKYHQMQASIPIDEKIEALEKEFLEIRKKHSLNDFDSITIKKLDPSGSILNAHEI
jgi:hypothetical protein